MDSKIKTFIGAGVVVAIAGGVYLSGWSPSQDGVGEGKRTLTATISTFDPDADIQFDMDAWGTQWPDDYQVQEAFYGAFGSMDECVAKFKNKKGIKGAKQLNGNVEMQVKLNPKEPKPFGVNAELPKKFKKAGSLNDCMRDAAAAVHYPTYDGPPLVVAFEFELDAGSYWEEE
jgi:hypothetical protein